MVTLAIACESGTYKGVFVHGVLSAFKKYKLYANAYGAASSSTLPTACAVIGKAREIGVDYWCEAIDAQKLNKSNMSHVVIRSIKKYSLLLRKNLFLLSNPRLIIAASAVITDSAAQTTQSKDARRLGRKLLISSQRGDLSWVRENLETHYFDTHDAEGKYKLNSDNLEEVAYASTRMLHAWDIPAWIDKKPYIDASYTCSCPTLKLADLGFSHIITVATEPGDTYTNIFQNQKIPNHWRDSKISFIKPSLNLKNIGVDYTSATVEGMKKAYEMGFEEGIKFVESHAIPSA